MDQGPADRGLTDRGFTSVQFLLASALALILFLVLANLVVVQYGRGAVKSALDQGARAGAVSGSPGDCEARSRAVIDQLLGGRMSDGFTVTCRSAGNLMVVRGSALFEAWTPLMPDFAVDMTSEAFLEPAR